MKLWIRVPVSCILLAFSMVLAGAVPAQAETMPGRNLQNSGSFSGGNIRPGHWEKTDEIFYAPAAEDRQKGNILIGARRPAEAGRGDMIFDFTVTEKTNLTSRLYHNCKGEHASLRVNGISGIEDSYPAGGSCSPQFRITSQRDEDHTPGSISGSLYFADIRPGSDAFGQEVTIREYFEKRRSYSYAQELLRDFSTEERAGSSGSSQTGKDTQEIYYDAECCFPRLTSEGDKIWIVMEFSDDPEEGPVMRNVWEYTWVSDPGTPAGEDAAEEHSENDPNWIKYVYEGHWDRTDIIYVNPGSETDADRPVRVRSERQGVDLQDIVYHYTKAGDGSEFTVTIPEPEFQDRYYSGDEFYLDVEIYCDGDEEDRGNVICALAFADIALGEGQYGVKVTPKEYLYGIGNETIETFGPVPHRDTMVWDSRTRRAKLFMEGCFPEGGENGEKIYLVYGSMDSESGINRLYNIHEYTWTKGPDVVWQDNPPMY